MTRMHCWLIWSCCGSFSCCVGLALRLSWRWCFFFVGRVCRSLLWLQVLGRTMADLVKRHFLHHCQQRMIVVMILVLPLGCTRCLISKETWADSSVGNQVFCMGRKPVLVFVAMSCRMIEIFFFFGYHNAVLFLKAQAHSGLTGFRKKANWKTLSDCAWNPEKGHLCSGAFAESGQGVSFSFLGHPMN